MRISWGPPSLRPRTIGLCIGAFAGGWLTSQLTQHEAPAPIAVPSPVRHDTATSSLTGPPVADAKRERTYVEMRNVWFHVHPNVALRIRNLRGTMQSLTRDPIFFDDPESFRIRIHTADVAIAPQDLTHLLNDYVLAYPGASLRGLEVSIDGNELVQKGRLKKGISLPFEIRSTVSLTPEGDIRIHATKTRLFGVGMTRLMRTFGVRLEGLVSLRQAKGARVEGNDIILDVEHALPRPAIEGRLASIRIEGNELVQRFEPRPGDEPLADLPVPDPGPKNYMFYKGGVLRFGKLVMLDADLQIVDMDPSDAFRFDIRRYLTQLVPGYSKTLRDGGLEVFMKDIDDASHAGTEGKRVSERSLPAPGRAIPSAVPPSRGTRRASASAPRASRAQRPDPPPSAGSSSPA
jgi:hypothetical protein